MGIKRRSDNNKIFKPVIKKCTRQNTRHETMKKINRRRAGRNIFKIKPKEIEFPSKITFSRKFEKEIDNDKNVKQYKRA